jgi:hypothetical protein
MASFNQIHTQVMHVFDVLDDFKSMIEGTLGAGSPLYFEREDCICLVDHRSVI